MSAQFVLNKLKYKLKRPQTFLKIHIPLINQYDISVHSFDYLIDEKAFNIIFKLSVPKLKINIASTHVLLRY